MTTLPGCTWTLGDTSVTRFGYGAMQLDGPWAVGPPADHDGALQVLRAAVEAGTTHIDTSGACRGGPLGQAGCPDQHDQPRHHHHPARGR